MTEIPGKLDDHVYEAHHSVEFPDGWQWLLFKTRIILLKHVPERVPEEATECRQLPAAFDLVQKCSVGYADASDDVHKLMGEDRLPPGIGRLSHGHCVLGPFRPRDMTTTDSGYVHPVTQSWKTYVIQYLEYGIVHGLFVLDHLACRRSLGIGGDIWWWRAIESLSHGQYLLKGI
ncbi:hypothetical protein PGQ11_012688 [Apiospora arundinis]|uniref:Uncharacterized protein n=1 Tax=Apiospora arundinis TaxID=335852 RepID=A0ABR2I368_9PEZI